MLKILKIILIIIIIGILGALDFWIVFKKGWPWWVGAAVLAGILGLWIGFLFFRKYFLRRKEKKFVHRVVQLDEAAIKSAPLYERQQLRELQDQWKESIELLKNSHLRKTGNPLYELPWFIVIGESNSGKTTAIKNSHLNSPVKDLSRVAGISATRNCDWWFFDEAVILDTAGRYTIPVDEAQDREEWEKFLTLLAKYRHREPINGVVITLPVDKILSPDKTPLREDGQLIRKRIDQLMRTAGAKFPIYVLVTKMDMVYGFTDVFLKLPDEDTKQAAGFLNKTGNMRWEEMLDQTFASITDSLRNICINLIGVIEQPEPGVLLLTNEFNTLKPGLKEFLKAVFEDNPYQESPLFRGIYFSSSRQCDEPLSEFLRSIGYVPQKQDKSVDKGLFLRDFFAQILPGDRSLLTHVYEYIRWRRLTRSLGFVSWFLIWLSLCGFLSFSFFHEVNTLGKFMEVFNRPPILHKDVSANLLMFEKYRLEISNLEKTNRIWYFPTFGLQECKRIEKIAKKHYIDLFNRGFLRQFDTSFFRRIDQIDESTNPDIMADYAGYAIARVRLLGSYLKDRKLSGIADFTKTSTRIMKFQYPDIPSEIADTLGNIYGSYLEWNEDGTEPEQSYRLFRNALIMMLRRHRSLEWLVYNPIPDAPDVRLEDFWGRPRLGSFDEAIFVSGVYTNEGRKHIETFLKTLEEVLKDNKLLQISIEKFWKWYYDGYYREWALFASSFSKGKGILDTDASRQTMATQMTTGQNPYYFFIKRLTTEMPASKQSGKTPSWVTLVSELEGIIEKSMQSKKTGEKKGMKGSVEGTIEKITQEVKKIDAKQEKIAERRDMAAKIFGEYEDALQQIAPLVSSRETCYQMVSDLFSGQSNLSESKSPFNVAYVKYLTFKHMIENNEYFENVGFVWKLFGGPLDYLIQHGINNAACILQERWEGDVLNKLDTVPQEGHLKLFFDKKDGVVWKFRDGPAKPFIMLKKWGYYPRKVYENTIYENHIPLESDFIKFLNSKESTVVEYRPKYAVKIETVPILANDDARLKPIGNILALQCSNDDMSLHNYNYPDAKTFVWAPETCGNTTLKIIFPGLTLTRTYEGKQGFAQFLSMFRTGSKTFKPYDFPDKQKELTKIGVKWIKVKYRIEGGEQVINVFRKTSRTSRLPAVIATCLSR